MPLAERFSREEYDENGRLVHFDLCYPEHYNFGYDVVDQMAAEEPDRQALIWTDDAGNERIFTFEQLRRWSNKVANTLKKRGIKKGDRVLLILKKRYEYWFIVTAIHKLGAIAVPVSYMLTEEDLAYRVDVAGASAAILVPDQAVISVFLSIQKYSPTLRQVMTIGPNIGDFDNLYDEIEAASDEWERVETNPHDPMIIYFSSGTTGRPKAVVHNHLYTLAHIPTAKFWQGNFDGGIHLTVADTGWAKASWGKIYGQWLTGAAVLVYDFETFDPRRLIAVMNQYHVTSFCAPPTIYRYMVKRRMARLPYLKCAASAGEYLDPEIAASFTRATGVSVVEGYGQTEAVLILSNVSKLEAKKGSLGLPMPFYDVVLLKEDGQEAKPGEIGEIVLRLRENQQGLFEGYINENHEIKRPIKDGYYHTGDNATCDEDGYYWFHGRMDDVIKTGGFRIGPLEIERILIRHPSVRECSVVGESDPLRGQTIHAFVVLNPGVTPSPYLHNELLHFSNSHLAIYMHIRRLDFIDELPKTFNGKVQKQELIKRYLKQC